MSVPTSGGVLKNLRETASGGDALILFLDCDREAEAIAFQVATSRAAAAARRLFAAPSSSVTAEDIARAMRSLGEPDANWPRPARAAGAETCAWAWLYALLDKTFPGQVRSIRCAPFELRPCQTPTLGFVVQREDEIATFAPEPFWELTAEATLAGETVDVAWQRGRCFDRAVAAALARGCGAEAVVAEATEGTRAQPPPLPFNTVELLKTASKVLPEPGADMRHAEHLYPTATSHCPRRRRTVPAVFRRRGRPAPAGGRRPLGRLRAAAPRRRRLVAAARTDAGDHPPITPTAPFDGGGPAGRLYELVARRPRGRVAGRAAGARRAPRAGHGRG